MTANKILEARELELTIEKMQRDLAGIVQDSDFQKKKEALDSIRDMMKEEGITVDDLASYFMINTRPVPTNRNVRKRKESPESVWTNPETGETYVGRRRAGKVKEWIEQHGADVVETWRKEL